MPRRKQKSETSNGAAKTRAPHGQIGQQTYDHVRRVAKEQGVPLTKAFEEVAKATGRKPGTIAVTYYRIGRKHGVGRKRRRGAGASTMPRVRGQKGRNADGLLNQVSVTLKQLRRVIAQQAHEIDRLTKEARLAQRIKRALQSRG